MMSKKNMERRRSTVSQDEGELRKEDLIKKEEVIVVLTKADYVKRLPATDFKSQRRGGRGINATKFKDGMNQTPMSGPYT